MPNESHIVLKQDLALAQQQLGELIARIDRGEVIPAEFLDQVQASVRGLSAAYAMGACW